MLSHSYQKSEVLPQSLPKKSRWRTTDCKLTFLKLDFPIHVKIPHWRIFLEFQWQKGMINLYTISTRYYLISYTSPCQHTTYKQPFYHCTNKQFANYI